MSTENVENLTFVGGKAVEQHEQPETNLEPDIREDAKEAVRKAIAEAARESKDSAEKAAKQDPYRPPGAKKDESDDGGKSPVTKKPAKEEQDTPERGPDGKFLPKGGKKASAEEEQNTEEAEEPGHSLKNLFKHREKVAAEKKAVNPSALDQERQKLAEETRKIQETWAQLQAEQARIQKERERFERLRKDPAGAIRDIGWNPEDFIVDLARDGTPEGQAARQQRELQQQIQEIKAWKEEQAKAAHRAQEEAQWHQQVQYRHHIEKTFLDDAMHEENRPHTAEFYKGRERALLTYADMIAAEYRELSNGREASLKEVADFIEEELAERANAWYVKKSGTKKDTVPAATPGKGSKGKSLSPEAASERRTLGRKALKDLDEEERLLAAREAVGAAITDSD